MTMTLEQPPRHLAIVTGASRQRGIGAAICRALARVGTDVLFTHWTPYDEKMPWAAEEDEPAHLQRQLQNTGVRCEHLSLLILISRLPYGKLVLK
jgi:3-oxoacyl-[acyl-carrier protein] reductase